MDSEGGMSLKAKPTNCGIVYRASKSIYFGANETLRAREMTWNCSEIKTRKLKNANKCNEKTP